VLVRIHGDFPAALLAAYLRHPVIEERLLADIGGAGTAGFSLDALRTLTLRRPPGSQAAALAELVEETDAFRAEVEEVARRLSGAAAETIFEQLSCPASE
jgi:hypothetical protein